MAPRTIPSPVPQQKPAPAPRASKAAEPPRPQEPPEPARAPEPPSRVERVDADPVNVRFDVTVSSQTGSNPAIKRSAMVTVSNGGGPGPTGTGMLRSGNNIPVPSTTFVPVGSTREKEDGTDSGTPRPMTSYNYRTVGLNVDANNVVVLPGNRVRALLNIEFSGVDEKASASTGAPAFPTFSQRLSLYLESGKPIVVAQSSDFVDNLERKQTVEVKASVLR